MGLSDKSLVLCVGSGVRQTTLDGILAGEVGDASAAQASGFLLGRGLEGRGWSIRAIVEATARFGAPLVLLPPNLAPQPDGADELGHGFSPSWIPRLLEPVRDHKQDLALAHFSRHILADVVQSLLAFPVMAGVFGFRLRQPCPGVIAVSNRLMRTCLSIARSRCGEIGDYGFDLWLVARALSEGLSICEVPLGAASFHHETGKLELVFRQVAHALLDQVERHDEWWLGRPDPVAAPRVAGPLLDVPPPPCSFDPHELQQHFRLVFDEFDETLFREIVPDAREKMEALADRGTKDAVLDAEEWVRLMREFLLAFSFERGFHRDDIVDGLFAFFLARLAGFIDEVRSLEDTFVSGERLEETRARSVVQHEAESVLEGQADLFVRDLPEFRRSWRERRSENTPYLPRLGAWEFVPHVEVIVPQELERPTGGSVWANQIYQQLIDRYREEFTRFVSEQLGIEEVADSSEILARVHQFMARVDRALDTDLFPGDLATVEGTREITEAICASFAEGTSFQLEHEAAEAILKRTPPRNLIAQLGCGNVGGLLDRLDPLDALGTAGWTDRQHHVSAVLDIIEKNGEPGWFWRAPLRPVVLDLSRLTNATELRGTAALARLAGRVVAGNLQKGSGGEFPKLWFVIKVIKSIVGVEQFSNVWQRFASDGGDFAARVAASIRGHWGRRVLSAHNAFENRQQRAVVRRLEEFAADVARRQPEKTATAALLGAAARVYHLSITLPDATFVPLSAWTWTSHSHRGGLGPPTPLSSLVERDWATRDFLTAYMESAGLGGEAEIDDKIDELVGQGRESDDLRRHLLGVSADPDRLVVRQMPDAAPPLARKLVRPVDGPILEPIADHAWESRYVLNAAAVRLSGTIYILYRAFGDDEISRVGLAWTRDGVHIDGRLDRPIFEPANAAESAGCEDPRVTVVGDRLYMLYTAWDRELPQIAMASIPTQAFVEGRFDAWERHGLGFPGLSNKDAVLYPDKFDGRYVIYHRIDPNMWISYLDALTCPWPKTGHKIVTGPRPGMMWDGVKIGAGAQPIKTTHGWLNIYHGVDYERSYRLGVLFMDIEDPARVIYQSPNPILEPEADFEIGRSSGRDYWVPHVVFTCGAVPAVDKEIVGPDDDILVYYGAADTAIGVARGRLRDIVPVLDESNAGRRSTGD
jgi:predicted GH43/DUF377 family glycosyl hydrolase